MTTMSPAWFNEEYNADSVAAVLSSATWTVVEVNTGIMFACLPMMKGPYTHLVALWRAWRNPARARSIELERAPIAHGQSQLALSLAPTNESAHAPVLHLPPRPSPASSSPSAPALALSRPRRTASDPVSPLAPITIAPPTHTTVVQPAHSAEASLASSPSGHWRSSRSRLSRFRLGRFVLGRFARSFPAPRGENIHARMRSKEEKVVTTTTVITAGGRFLDAPVFSSILVIKEIEVAFSPRPRSP